MDDIERVIGVYLIEFVDEVGYLKEDVDLIVICLGIIFEII